MAERRHDGLAYRLDRDECHGIKELLVLLTHLYDNRVRYFIVDELELSLHPQYQAFFMQEVRKVTEDSTMGSKGKIVFLITHSPFILDIQSVDDLQSTILFDREYSKPQLVADLNLDFSFFTSPLSRLSAHHRQLFFSDNPVFVEGPHDASIVQALMEARGTSVAGAGSCIIDAGGVEEVNHYLTLCLGLGKKAHFIYDLDSLFKGKLRKCIRDDDSIQSFLASVGLGNNFANAFSLLQADLGDLIKRLSVPLQSTKLKGLEDTLNALGDRKCWGNDGWARARLAVMIATDLYREEMVSATCEGAVASVEGRRDQIHAALELKNIHVLPGGTLERYLPNFKGEVFRPSQEAKQKAVEAELSVMQKLQECSGLEREKALSERYGELYAKVCRLPSKTEADVDVVLRKHLSDYTHELQKAVKDNPNWQHDQLQRRMSGLPISKDGFVSLQEFERTGLDGFRARIGITAIQRHGPRTLGVTERTTIANMGELELDH